MMTTTTRTMLMPASRRLPLPRLMMDLKSVAVSADSLRWNCMHTATTRNMCVEYTTTPKIRRCQFSSSASTPSLPLQTLQVSGPKNIPSRSEQIAKLQSFSDSEMDSDNDSTTTTTTTTTTPTVTLDVLVIGGGATGCGIALDAVTRKHGDTVRHVACLERSDFGSETSSRSTKLLWAGIRYMATAVASVLNQPLSQWFHPTTLRNFASELKMVLACHQERRYMLERQRHLTHWVPIAVPFTGYIRASQSVRESGPPPFGNAFFHFFPALAPAVFKLYDALSHFRCPPSYSMGTKTAATAFPNLRLYQSEHSPTGSNTANTTTSKSSSFIKYVGVFYEAMHNDARTCLAIAMAAAEQGAVMCNYVEAVALIHQANDSDDEHRKRVVVGAVVRDNITGTLLRIRAKKVVLAGGPFTDQLRTLETAPEDGLGTAIHHPAVRGAAGTHIVLRGGILPAHHKMGLLDYNTSDGRFLFVLPWLGHTLVGTTDDVTSSAQTRHDPPERDIQWLLKECQTYLNVPPLQRSDVLSAWRGWRPLAVDPHAPPNSPPSRDHVISENPDTGVLFVAGGKWTTWREMAQDVVDRITSQPCRTLEIQLYGGPGYTDDLAEQLIQKYPELDVDVAEHLVSTYGGRVWDVVEQFTSLNSSDISSGHPPLSPLLQQRLVPGFPYVEAEVVYACREYACTVEDILSRRTRLAYLNKDAAMAALPRVAHLMAETLGWSDSVRQQQMEQAVLYMTSYGGREPVDVAVDNGDGKSTNTREAALEGKPMPPICDSTVAPAEVTR